MFRQQSGEDGAVTLRPPRADDTAVLITARDDAFRRWLGADHVRVRLFGGHLAEESAAHERVERMFAELLEEMTDGSAVAGLERAKTSSGDLCRSGSGSSRWAILPT